jgi:hypothetical protein
VLLVFVGCSDSRKKKNRMPDWYYKDPAAARAAEEAAAERARRAGTSNYIEDDKNRGRYNDDLPKSLSSGDSGCLSDAGDRFGRDGKFSTRKVGSRHLAGYMPANIPQGCRVPVVLIGTNTNENYIFYEGLMKHMASWGFLALVYEPDPGSKDFDKACRDAVEEVRSADIGEDIAADSFGIIGRFDRAAGALDCTHLIQNEYSRNARVATAIISPSIDNSLARNADNWERINSPLLIMTLQTDANPISNILNIDVEGSSNKVFERLRTEIKWYRALGGANAANWQEPAKSAILPYFRWKLLGDTRAKAEFLDLPSGNMWDEVDSR